MSQLKSYIINEAAFKSLAQKKQDFHHEEVLINEVFSQWLLEKKNDSDFICFLKSKNESNNKLDFLVSFFNRYEFSNVSERSFMNFLRHLPYLVRYFLACDYDVFPFSDMIKLKFNGQDVVLVLTFKNDFTMDFFSYDNDVDAEKDKLVYSVKGTFSSSSKLKKSYKIKRLMSLLDTKKEQFLFLKYESSTLSFFDGYQDIEMKNISMYSYMAME